MVRNESEIAAQARRRRLFEGIYIPEVQQVFSVAAELFDRFEQAVVRLRCAALGSPRGLQFQLFSYRFFMNFGTLGASISMDFGTLGPPFSGLGDRFGYKAPFLFLFSSFLGSS